MTKSCPLPSGRDCIASAVEWKGFVEELRRQWKLLWRERIDDKVRAEGISCRDFELLFVDRGMVVVATRDYKPPVFREIVEQYDLPYTEKAQAIQPNPSVGGWRKFARKHVVGQKRTRQWRAENERKKSLKRQQLKKGGRGWLHVRM